MQELPHHYSVTANATDTAAVTLQADKLTNIESAPPSEFGGPGNLWSPEALLVAAVADCFVLSFRAVARGFKLDWVDVECQVTGTLDRVDNKNCFTAFAEHVVLTVPQGTEEAKARKVLEKAEHVCLVTNSLTGAVELTTEIRFSD